VNVMAAYILMLAAGMQIAGCPPTIKDTQTVAVDRTWAVRVSNRPRLLERVMLYSGEPSRRRSLQPVPGKNRSSAWSFAGENIWVECMYLGSSAILSKNLGSLKSCVYLPAEDGTSDPAKLTCEKAK
jgi:hypothetical protein